MTDQRSEDRHPRESGDPLHPPGPEVDSRFRGNDVLTRLEVIDRLIAYWWDVDKHDARSAASFYTPDCVYWMTEHRMDGPAAVQAYYDYRASRGARLVRHVLTNLRATVHAPDRASVEGVLTVYAADGQPVLPSAAPILVADNTAEFVRGDDGVWRMQEHRIEALFRGGVPVLVPPGA